LAQALPRANCQFDFASLIAETALLGAVSQRTGKYLLWDAASMRFPNDSDANQYVTPERRARWTL
jgi:hypothetical protein